MGSELDIRQRAWKQLRRHAHQILAGGYGRLNPADFAQTNEPAITGNLCQAMCAFMAMDDAPRWIKNYSIRDDPNVNVPDREGNARPRIDIEVERVQRGPRPIFRFEAKRLDQNHTIGMYLGSEGMGAFLSGYYPLTHPEAGMIGYFQDRDLAHWQKQLDATISSNPESYSITTGTGLTSEKLTDTLSTWKTLHSTDTHPSLTILHTLMRFC